MYLEAICYLFPNNNNRVKCIHLCVSRFAAIDVFVRLLDVQLSFRARNYGPDTRFCMTLLPGHCFQILRPDLISQMKELGIVANIQPQFVPTDARWAAQVLPEELLNWSYPWRTLLHQGDLCGDFGF